jgi:Piwi domain
MTVLEARLLPAPRLSFSPAIPSRIHTQAYRGMQTYGPFDSSRVNLTNQSILFVFPESYRSLARRLVLALRDGYKTFPGFGRMFRVTFANDQVESLVIGGDFSTPVTAAKSYREEIARWNAGQHTVVPQLALVLVPHSERWQTDRPYYEAKAAFAHLGIPTQMVTSELLENEREFAWSVANIALAVFAKLGGVPWAVESPSADHDLVIGVGRADIRRSDGTERIFGYALSFVSNGIYRQNWSFTPASNEETYSARLEEAISNALTSPQDTDAPFRRLVVHLGKKTSWREIRAVQQAILASGVRLPLALLRLDDSTLYDIADGRSDTLAPPKGLAVRLGLNRRLLQAEGATATGVPYGPILVELDDRSDVGPEQLDDLVIQAFRLAHANWRGFNARSQPVTLVYGELLARLVGYLEEVATWEPTLLRSDLRDKPWFL